jgi:antitoxin HicB
MFVTCTARAYPLEILSLSSEDGGGYLIVFPSLSGCISDGDTLGEALHNGFDAAESWLRTAVEFGDPIADPVALEYAPTVPVCAG